MKTNQNGNIFPNHGVMPENKCNNGCVFKKKQMRTKEWGKA